MHRAYPIIAVLAVVASIFAISACTKKPIDQAPLGPQSLTGTLIPADNSLVRRGTHLLMVNGKKMYFVESKTESLKNYEGQTVHIEGTAEQNTNITDLPVLVATKVVPQSGSKGLHLWNIPALDLAITGPDSWQAAIKNSVATFTLSGEPMPLMTVSIATGSSLPPGIPLYIGSHRAVRKSQAEGSLKQDVYVLDKDSLLYLHFDPTTQLSIQRLEDAKLLAAQFENLLLSLRFISDKATVTTPTASGSDVFCGGVAGVICPAGSYCDVYDQQSKIGRCRQR